MSAVRTNDAAGEAPLMSVVIPAFNASATIGRTLASLARQVDPRWEAVVVDDGSADGTADAARRFGDPRVRVVAQANAGPSAARNRGFRETAAPLVCFLDADDTLEPWFLAALGPRAVAHPLGAAGGYRFVGETGETIHERPAPGPDALSAGRLLALDPPAIHSILHRRDALETIAPGGRLFDETMRSHEDWDVVRRLGKRFAGGAGGTWSIEHGCVAVYRCVPGSLSGDIRRVLSTGLALIEMHAPDRVEAARHARRHRLSCLGGCVVSGDASLAAEIAASVGPSAGGPSAGAWTGADGSAVAAAVGWHAMRRWGLREDGLGGRVAPTRRSAARMLPRGPVLDAVLARIDRWGTRLWDGPVREAASGVGRGGRLVVFGLGRNGAEALRSVRALAIDRAVPVVVCDDDASRGAEGFERVVPRAIRRRDAVLVTPVSGEAIVRSLRARGVARVVAPCCEANQAGGRLPDAA